ncbi:DUF3224 domain-containing protein [Streptomyces sp. NPDC021356]|uniref:DUF3224 domain-containing protein n=1 Tax=Streptomyces sp. NPDC021356 TaxID=3154900 RepID=UPI0033C0D1AF
MKSFTPADVEPDPDVSTGLPVGVATLEKHFEGEIDGRPATLSTAAYDQATGVGTYVAMESFEGGLHGRRGALDFVHPATTTGSDRSAEFFTVVPAGGTDERSGYAAPAAWPWTARTAAGSTTSWTEPARRPGWPSRRRPPRARARRARRSIGGRW